MLTTLAVSSEKKMAPVMLEALTTLAGSIEALVEAHAHHVIGVTLEAHDIEKRAYDDQAARSECESAFLLVQELILDSQNVEPNRRT